MTKMLESKIVQQERAILKTFPKIIEEHVKVVAKTYYVYSSKYAHYFKDFTAAEEN